MPDDFDIGRIDEVIHGRVRLGVMAFLAGAGGAEFNEIKGRLGTTDGNLSIHLKKLEDAGYVAIDKQFRAKKPVTTVSLTPAGRKAFATYLDAIGRLVDQVGRAAEQDASKPSRSSGSERTMRSGRTPEPSGRPRP